MDARRFGWRRWCIILWWREGGLGGTVGAPRKTDCFVGGGGYLIGLSD
jgi:hypothetical protein